MLHFTGLLVSSVLQKWLRLEKLKDYRSESISEQRETLQWRYLQVSKSVPPDIFIDPLFENFLIQLRLPLVTAYYNKANMRNSSLFNTNRYCCVGFCKDGVVDIIANQLVRVCVCVCVCVRVGGGVRVQINNGCQHHVLGSQDNAVLCCIYTKSTFDWQAGQRSGAHSPILC